MATDNDRKKDFQDSYDVKRAAWSGFLIEATEDTDYYHRAQYTADELLKAKEQDRRLQILDKIHRQINLISGYEIRNRHSLIIGPQGFPNETEDKACEQHTGIIANLMALNGGGHVCSDCFKWGTLVQGSNLLEIWKDRNGDLQFSRLGYNEFLIDPSTKRPDLKDCDDILTGRWLSEQQVKLLLPDRGDEISEIPVSRFGKRWDYLGNPALGNKAGLRMYEERWYRQTDFVSTVIPRISVQNFKKGVEFSLESFAKRYFDGKKGESKKFLRNLQTPDGNPAFSVYDKPVDRVYLDVMVDDEIVWHGRNPLFINEFNFIWFFGEYCPEYPRSELKLQGYVRGLKDPQNAFNRRINQIYDMLETQIMSLRVLRDKYIKNPEDAYKSGQGVVIHGTDDVPDAMPLKDLVYQGSGSDIPAGLFAALEATDKAETESQGLNNEIFGSDDKDNVPGILSRFRTGQALTGQAGVFENYNISKRLFGRRLVELVQLNYPPEKVYNLINELPAQGFYKHDLTKYDCHPVETILTDSQKEMFYIELKGLRQIFPEEAHLIPLSVMAKYSPSPFAPTLMNIIRQGEQRLAQRQKEAEEAQRRAIALQEAVTKSELAQAAERSQQAFENKTQAALDRVNTMAKIQELKDKPVRERMKLAIEAKKLENAAKD